MTSPLPAAATVADDAPPELLPAEDHAREVKPVRYRPNRHERRKAEALKRKEQRGRK